MLIFSQTRTALLPLIALTCMAKGQSVSIAIHKTRETAIEFPAYQTKLFKSADWKLVFDLDEISGNGVGSEFAIEHRFWTAYFLNLPIVSAYWHIGFGETVQSKEEPHSAFFLGIAGRIGKS